MSGPSGDGLGQHLTSTRSFTRMQNTDTHPSVSNPATDSTNVPAQPLTSAIGIEGQEKGPDVFERRGSAESSGEGDGQGDEGFVLSRSLKDPSEELPIELVSLTDRFINSLSAKVHNSPPTIDKISSLFQVFYSRSESHIATHISALASRINRDPTPQVQSKPRGGAFLNLGSKLSQEDVRGGSARQMLTAEEVAERRKARKALELKRAALEEAAERRVCELVYDKVWRHKTTLDDVRDEKLRSKTAALLLVGINLKDLGIDLDMSTIADEKQQEANDCLAQARECLANMNDQHYPLGKLQLLAAAHKAIVDALTKLLPSTSSADEILPTLIYTLVTCPPEGINIISNLLFIQRFRSSTKIDGETAYCLTNLEAAISFLENVELSSLRADEPQEGPPKTPSISTTPSSERVDPLRPTKETTTSSVATISASPEIAKPEVKEPAATLPRPSVTPQQRRLSNLFQPPTKVLEAANDAVRNTADQSLKNISASLDNSFNFLFGRLKELQTNQGSSSPGSGTMLPKTLADARRFVAETAASKSLTPEEVATINALSSEQSSQLRPTARDAETSSGGRTPRDRSTDSARTQASSKKSIYNESIQTPPSVASPNPLESMRNFGNTLNPLNHIPGMMRGFGRAGPETPTGRSVSPAALNRVKTSPALVEVNSGGASSLYVSSARVDPPIQRFLETQNASDLRLGDVALLLEDYKRLAAALSRAAPAS